MLDVVARHFYELSFKLSFMGKKSDEFLRPWGDAGNRTNDGYLRARRPLVQCYAPNDINAATTVSKIDEDSCHVDSAALRP